MIWMKITRRESGTCFTNQFLGFSRCRTKKATVKDFFSLKPYIFLNSAVCHPLTNVKTETLDPITIRQSGRNNLLKTNPTGVLSPPLPLSLSKTHPPYFFPLSDFASHSPIACKRDVNTGRPILQSLSERRYNLNNSVPEEFFYIWQIADWVD